MMSSAEAYFAMDSSTIAVIAGMDAFAGAVTVCAVSTVLKVRVAGLMTGVRSFNPSGT